MSDRTKRIEELKKQINDLRSRWPAHSAPSAMLQELDDLDEELARLQKEAQSEGEED